LRRRDNQVVVLNVAAFPFEGGAAAVALNVHLEDGGVVYKAIDHGQRLRASRRPG
jgi:hypothetical protein